MTSGCLCLAMLLFLLVYANNAKIFLWVKYFEQWCSCQTHFLHVSYLVDHPEIFATFQTSTTVQFEVFTSLGCYTA